MSAYMIVRFSPNMQIYLVIIAYSNRSYSQNKVREHPRGNAVVILHSHET